jgi:mitochondrial fission protein ELM1
VSSPLVVWCIADGKTGHINQMRGLVKALGKLAPVEVYTIPGPSLGRSVWYWLRGRFPLAEELPRPRLILGAGHSTHLAVLAARRAFGGLAVVLMKPTLPMRWFGLCLVPEHDDARPYPNVIVTRGVLNTVTPSSEHSEEAGLFLIGGPSAQHGWSDAEVVGQIQTVVARERRCQWILTTSRRTPASLVSRLRALRDENLLIVPLQRTDDHWISDQLKRAGQVWVTEDSVSMIYEAITAGAAVGLLHVPRSRPGRVVHGLRALAEQGWVTQFDAWRSGQRLRPAPTVLDEATRCAELIAERLTAAPSGGDSHSPRCYRAGAADRRGRSGESVPWNASSEEAEADQVLRPCS